MPFIDANILSGLSSIADFQVGKSNVDSNKVIEEGIELPFTTNPTGSYLYYDCTVAASLDSGIVVHNRLPQVDNEADTLASVFLDNENLATITDKGVNLTCKDQYTDIMQRMGHSRYWFRIWGRAMRIGYKIPIPAIKTIGGVVAIPYDRNPQWAYNGIVPGSSFGGVVLWRAYWSLWYTTLVPPKNQTIPAADPSTLITGTPVPPKSGGIQVPYSQADDEAVAKPPRIIDDGIIGVTGR